jgi:hypothetical protein
MDKKTHVMKSHANCYELLYVYSLSRKIYLPTTLSVTFMNNESESALHFATNYLAL